MWRKVTSREYKVMLRRGKFRRSEESLDEPADRFWSALSARIASIALDIDGDFRDRKPVRAVSFFDTSDFVLNRSSYILRQRGSFDGQNDGDEFTVKLRHPDRHIAQDRDTDPPGLSSDSKFEEDIKPPFRSLYSSSTTFKANRAPALRTLGDVGDLFADIRKRTEGFNAEDPLIPVRDRTQRELVLRGASLQLGKNPDMRAECALVVWYSVPVQEDGPAAVEFSFRYRDEQERYEGAMARRAFAIFNIIQKELPDWVDLNAGTKTELMYDQ